MKILRQMDLCIKFHFNFNSIFISLFELVYTTKLVSKIQTRNEWFKVHFIDFWYRLLFAKNGHHDVFVSRSGILPRWIYFWPRTKNTLLYEVNKKITKNFCDVIDVSIRPKIPDDDYDKVYKKSKKKKFSWQHQISIKD